MSIDVFGFPGILEDQGFDNAYAIIPAMITSWSGNQIVLPSLSAPGLSGSAIVCAKTGVPAEYRGGGLDGSVKNEQYKSHGYTFHGIVPKLPSSLPRSTHSSKRMSLSASTFEPLLFLNTQFLRNSDN
ncbi:uncharacterized protein PHALS_05390 [Plasmopara halstedii]|uniref:Uncharacterized protein n=1 Tax=Plasmopara halstedii TaxID=4781 RepID=A0A0N7L440_PLAHL|nr:uncharacterized protein PHALS_05390 [Plasmopara halstedii]CEG37611.1 hypothetical protein PHALS_05390 [Plasmopara halstedii]|eukprot:XP_024573980.1 hypothetical protein PHALS_05390 [Plasmopara halstedii]